MLLFPIVGLVAVVCAVGAYGILKRRRWAWWLGLVFQFVTAAAFGTVALPAICALPDTLVAVFARRDGLTVFWPIVAAVGMAAPIVLWVGWAAWWARRRRDFGLADEE